MYKNVGQKIKGLAVISATIMAVAGAISWLYFITNGYESYLYGYQTYTSDDWIGWICLLAGAVSFISSWILYGFGQIVEDVSAIRGRAEAVSTPNANSDVSTNDLPDL